MHTPRPSVAIASVGECLDIEQLYGQYASYVATIGLRLLGRDSEIEDLVQDVFLEAVRSIGKLRDPAAIKGWLATLSVRAARKRIRRRRVHAFVFGSDSVDYSVLVDRTASPEERLLLSRSYAVLDSLPANQRLAWVLRYFEGEPLAVVAERCECSLATVKRHIQRAQDHLQKELGDA